MSSQIKLSKEKQQAMIEEIKSYFFNERNEEIGELAAVFILDFFTEKLAPEFYNQGVFDSYRFISEKTEDLLGIQK